MAKDLGRLVLCSVMVDGLALWGFVALGELDCGYLFLCSVSFHVLVSLKCVVALGWRRDFHSGPRRARTYIPRILSILRFLGNSEVYPIFARSASAFVALAELRRWPWLTRDDVRRFIVALGSIDPLHVACDFSAAQGRDER